MKRRRILYSVIIAIMFVGGAIYISIRNSRASANLSIKPVLSTENSPKTTLASQVTLGSNKTEELGARIVSDYANSKTQYGQVDKNTATKIGQDALNSVIDQGGAPEVFYIKKLETFPDNDKTKLKLFTDTFTQIQNKYENIYASDSIGQLDGVYLQSQQGQDQLKRVSKMYTSLADELQNIPVPASQESVYVSLLQVYLNYSKNLLLMSNIKADPTNAMVGLMRQMEIWDQDLVIIDNLGRYLHQQGIV